MENESEKMNSGLRSDLWNVRAISAEPWLNATEGKCRICFLYRGSSIYDVHKKNQENPSLCPPVIFSLTEIETETKIMNFSFTKAETKRKLFSKRKRNKN